MATKARIYPMEVGLVRDPRVRQAIKVHGNFALLVLLGLYDYILKEGGYYVSVNEFLYEDIATYISCPDKVKYVKAVVIEFVNSGMFNKRMFSVKKVLTSFDIQRKYKAMVYYTSHRSPKIDKAFALDRDQVNLNPDAEPAQDRVRDKVIPIELIESSIREDSNNDVAQDEKETTAQEFDPSEREKTEQLFDNPGNVPPVDCGSIIRLFRITLGEWLAKPNEHIISNTRRRNIISRDKDLQRLNMTWSAYFKRIKDSDFLCGRVPNATWKADFDWAIKSEPFHKVLNGKYDNRNRPGPPQPQYSGMGFEDEIARIQKEYEQ